MYTPPNLVTQKSVSPGALFSEFYGILREKTLKYTPYEEEENILWLE